MTTSALRRHSSPRTVISPASPGPAPIRYTAAPVMGRSRLQSFDGCLRTLYGVDDVLSALLEQRFGDAKTDVLRIVERSVSFGMRGIGSIEGDHDAEGADGPCIDA